MKNKTKIVAFRPDEDVENMLKKAQENGLTTTEVLNNAVREVGFKAVLAECRGYRLTPDGELRRRKIRRAAERLVLLMGQGSVEVHGHRVVVV